MSRVYAPTFQSQITVTHGGAAGTFQNDVLIAAPALGHRWRIHAWSVVQDEADVSIIRGFLTQSAIASGAFVVFGLGNASGQRDSNGIIPGGFVLPAATQLTLRWASNTAAGVATISAAVIYSDEEWS